MTETTQASDASNTSQGQTTPVANAPATLLGSETAAEATTSVDAQNSTTQAVTGAPEKYEFTQPEDGAFDPTVLDNFAEVARELNMPQESAQKILDKITPVIRARQQEAIHALHAEWTDSTKTDKEIGGDKLNENLAVAKKALDQFGTPALKDILNQSGLGNHPEIIRAFYRAGKAVSEDKVITGGTTTAAPKDAANVLYPNQSKS